MSTETAKNKSPTAAQVDRVVRQYVVKLDDGVWLSDGEGDPARTLVFENAKRFRTNRQGVIALQKARQFRPFRRAEVHREDRQPIFHRGGE